MKFLIISVLIISVTYVLSDEVVHDLKDIQRISRKSSRNNHHHFSGKRIRIKTRKSSHKHNKTTTASSVKSNILNGTNNDLYNLNIDYLPAITIKLPVLPIHNLTNHKPIEYGNDWTHWEIPKGQYFTVLQTLMIQRENIDVQIQHTFGLLNAERKLRGETLLNFSDYSPCNKKKSDNNENKEMKKENEYDEKLVMNQIKSAQITFNETVSGRLDCKSKVSKEEV